MSDQPTPEQLVDSAEARYRFRFAGHARVSRDPEVIDQMLADLTKAEEGADDALKKRIQENRDLYIREREAIVEARAVPGAVQGFRLRLWGDLAVGRYRRGFSGKPRNTRDVTLLDEIRAFMGRLRDEMVSMDAAAPHLGLGTMVESTTRTVELARREAEQVRVSRSEGTAADQGSRLAQLANDQFAVYQQGFAGQSRLSRHPPRLERIVKALEEIGAGMARLQRDGFVSEQNDLNLKLVTERTRSYRTEITAMREAQAAASLEDRVNSLGAAANQVFSTYREEFAGKDRSKADADRLDSLFEDLFAIVLEMDAIDRDDGDETNERNLALVLDQLLMYQREWNAIREATTSGA